MTATPSASPARPAHVNTPPSLGGAIARLGFFCFVSLLFLGISIQKASDVLTELELLREGEIATGVILNRHGESDEEGDTYWVEYQLGPLLKDKSNPTLHRNQVAVDWETYASARPRSSVLIRYLPAAPEINRLDQQQPLIGDLATLVFLLIAAMPIITMVIISLQDLHHATLLACRGRQVMAQVVDRWKEDRADCTFFWVSYRFPAYPSPPFDHYAAEVNHTAYEKLSVNDHVMVCFVPDRPEICRLKL
jgi:hypothetical protein